MPFISFDEEPKSTFVDFSRPEVEKPEESTWSALKRGATESFQQLPQLARGVQAGIGAAAESVLGEGGIATGIKKSGIEGYKAWGDKIAEKSQESDSIDYSWDKAKEGDFGSLVNWLAHGLGYVGGQAVQTLATGGIGAVGGKFVAGTAAKQIAEGMVAKEAARLTAENAGLAVGERMAADAIAKTATQNVAAKFATIGATTALAASATGMEGGEIFGGLASENPDRVLTGNELGKAFASTLAAGGLEFVGDKLGLDIMLGKSSLLKPAQFAQGMGGRAARGLIAGGAAAPIEAGTEYLQTGLEEFGKGKEQNILPFNQSEEAQKQAREGAALGALGGGVIGGLGGGLRGAKERPEPRPEPHVADILDAPSVDDAIGKAGEILDTPVTPAAIDAGRQFQELGISTPKDDLAMQRQLAEAESNLAARAQDRDTIQSEREGAAASQARDQRLHDAGQAWQDLGVSNPLDDLQAQRMGLRESQDVSSNPDLQSLPASSTRRGDTEPGIGLETALGRDGEQERSVGTGLPESVSPSESVAPADRGNADAVEPAKTWFGRKGDGYVTEGDAVMALPSRQKIEPDLNWRVEPMPSGKFRLAGYADAVVKSGDETPQAQAQQATPEPVSVRQGAESQIGGSVGRESDVSAVDGQQAEASSVDAGMGVSKGVGNERATGGNVPTAFDFTRNATGTLTVHGDPAAIRAAGINGVAQFKDGKPAGILVSVNNAPAVSAQLEAARVQNNPENPANIEAAPAQARAETPAVDGRAPGQAADTVAGSGAVQAVSDTFQSLKSQAYKVASPIFGKDIYSKGVQNDWQKLLDAYDAGDKAGMVQLASKYRKDEQLDGLGSGTAGAGPGRVNQAKAGAAQLARFARLGAQAIESNQPQGTPNGTQADQAKPQQAKQQEAPAAAGGSLFNDPVTGKTIVTSNKATAEALANSKQLKGTATVRKATADEMRDDVAKRVGYGNGENLGLGYVIEIQQQAPSADPRLTPVSQRATKPIDPRLIPKSTRAIDPEHIGADNTPLFQGGKPFKSKAEANTARKSQPMMRVIKSGKGFALAPKTEKQLAAQAAAARRLATPRTGKPGVPMAAHEAIATSGGLAPALRAELGIDGNIKIGNRHLFAGEGKGLTLERATELLTQDGFLKEGASHNDVIALIKRSLTNPQYTPEGFERMAEAEANTRFEDYIAAQQESAQNDDLFAPDLDHVEIAGYSDADESIRAEVNALMEQAEAEGIDTDTIREEAHEDAKNGTDRDYLEAQRARAKSAISDRAGSGVTQADQRQDSEQGRQDAERAGRDDSGETAGAQSGEWLTAPTREEVLAQQDRAEQAEKDKAQADKDAEAKAKAERIAKEIASRQEASTDNFQLGQSAEDALAGQGSIFDAPADKPASAMTASEHLRAAADKMDAEKAGRLDNIGETDGSGNDIQFSKRGTNEPMTNKDVVGNQGGRSADDSTPGVEPLRLAPYSHAEMIARGADGNLSRGYERYVPIDKLDGLEPVPSNNESDDGEYHPGKPITQPIEVQANIADGTFIVYSGNHRIAQAKANGQTHILAFVEPDPNDSRGVAKGSVSRTNPDANESTAPDSGGAMLSRMEDGITRREALIAAIAAATNTKAQASTTLGKAKPISAAVLSQQMSPTVAKILRGNGATNPDGAKAVKNALMHIAVSGPVELRAFVQQISSMLPKEGFMLTVDDVGLWNAHGAVRFKPLPELLLFTAEGRTGLTYETFLHELLHMVVAAKYKTLGSTLPSNYAKLQRKTPAAMAQIEQFNALWREFGEVAKGRLDGVTDKDMKLSLREAINNPDEFFVRSLTEPRFQSFLAGIEYKGKTLLQRFKDWVKTSLFGFKTEGTAPSWLDAALLASSEVMEAAGRDASDFATMGAMNDFMGSKGQNQAMLSRAIDSPINLSSITQTLKDATAPIGTVSLWDKTIGTKYHLSTKDADFKRVFDGYVQQTDDTAHYAIESERMAPDILMRLESLGDIWSGLMHSGAKHKANVEAVSKALFANIEGKTGIQSFVFDDLTLKQVYKLTPKQIEMYRQARKAVDTSIERLAQTFAAQMGADQGMDISSVKNFNLEDTVEMVKTHIKDAHDELRSMAKMSADVDDAKEIKAPTKEETAELLQRLSDMQDHAKFLQENAYMPAMRFGEFAVTVTKDGETLHFEMFESKTAANLAAMKLKKEYPDADIAKSVMNPQQYAMFKGVSPETVELFAKFTGMDKSEAYQDYIALAKSARSVKMRELQRKGTAGFSEDATRVLASFITSNARQSAVNMNANAINDAMASKALAKKGDVQREAQKLHEYMANPLEEARRIRGFMFMHFMGGSIASAAVNLTQPVLQTAPYLHQFAGAKVAGIMARSAKMAATGKIDGKELADAVKRAAEDGITEPHEIHQLMADASNTSLGSSLKARAAIKAWGSFFALTEAYNRRLTFIAAYQTAQETKVKDAYEFARKAVIETQGLYAKVNRPNWARGAVGATLFTFKQFSIAYMEFLARLPTKQKALALTMLVLAAGLQGLPGADDLEDLIDTLGQSMGYNTNSKKALRKMLLETFGKDLGEVLDSGIFTKSTVDVQGRLGMGNLFPATAIFKPSETDKSRTMSELAGPLGGILTAFQNAVGKVQRGDYGGSVMEMSPVAIKNLAKGIDMMASGVYKDTRGRKVADVDALDSFVKMLGLQPSSIAKSTRILSDELQDKGMVNTVEAMIADKWAQGVHEKDYKQVMEARRTLIAWNQNNPLTPIKITPAQIQSRVKQMNLTRVQRYLKTTPKELRANSAKELAQ